MFKIIRLSRAAVCKFVLLVAVVWALVWYVGLKRAEFLRGPVTAPTAGSALITPRVQVSETDYFIDSRIDRERARSQEIEWLREVMNGQQTDSQTRRDASARFLSISKDAARETEVEQLVKAKGYEDCVVFSGSVSTVVVVKAVQITQIDVARIAEIVVQVIGGRLDALRVIARQ